MRIVTASLIWAALSVSAGFVSPPALAEDDAVLRLPTQGAVRDRALRRQMKTERLKDGAGLFVSFDKNDNGVVTREEISSGIQSAFARADANRDGNLTPLEQRDWARKLPTHDDTLANPTRFDPNLDRRVDIAEFTMVVENLVEGFADEASNTIVLADLKAPKTKREQRRDETAERAQEQRQGRRRNTTDPQRSS